MKLNKDKKNRPDIKINLTYIDWLLELVSLAVLLAMISLSVHYLSQLPDRIPTHFNFLGIPDGFGSKSSILVLPGTGMFIYLLLTIVSFFPKTYNFLVKITEQNARIQYKLATRFIRILKTLVLMMFAFLNYMTLGSAMHKSGGPGKIFIPVFLVLIFGSVIYYMVKSMNNKQNS